MKNDFFNPLPGESSIYDKIREIRVKNFKKVAVSGVRVLNFEIYRSLSQVVYIAFSFDFRFHFHFSIIGIKYFEGSSKLLITTSANFTYYHIQSSSL